MNILVVNAGSSSLKYQLIEMTNEEVLAKGTCERIGLEGSRLKAVGKNGASFVIEKPMPNHKEAVQLMLQALTDKEYGVVSDVKDIDAVGHRVVHSGEDFDRSVLIDDKVLEICRKNSDLAPLHVPANIIGIMACKEVMPDTPMAAVFDTAFHSTIPQYAYMYALPYKFYEEWKIRKYGFHGTSHKYVAQEAARYLGKDIKDLKIITCHLGNGSSITAVQNGKSVDTSMGFTPLEGLPMGTRSGDIDPAVIEFVMQKTGWTISQMMDCLNKQSGVLGVSGVSSDFRDLIQAMYEGNKRADLALDIFCYRIKKYIGAYAAVMNGVDVIVFTAGIGEHNPEVRERVVKGLDYLGLEFDNDINYKAERGKLTELSKPASKVKVLLVPTNEELVIARETQALVKNN
ncbi:MAG TPA: acetate kinase [Clostridia bacterium]